MIDLMVISHASFMAINRHIYQLIAKDNYVVEIITPKKLKFPTGFKTAEAKQDNDPVIHFLELDGTNPRTYFYKNLIPILDTRKPKYILLDNDPVSFLAGKIGRWAKKNNCKLYCISCENLPLTITDNFNRRGLKNLPNVVTKRILIERNKSKIDGVLCINKDGVDIFNAEGFKNVAWMPLGFDTDIFYPNDVARQRIRTKINLHTFTIAYFGRIIPEKGVHLLINALHDLKHLDWILLMDSFDEYKTSYIQEIKQLIKDKNLGSRILFFNASHYEIADYMNATDLVVVPSVTSKTWKEQYGRVAAEAMACGKLVLASNSGALPELLNGNGVLFEEGNVAALKIALENIITAKDIQLPTSNTIATYAKQTLSIDNQNRVIQEQILRRNND
jgi:glycosyltransferase involved in cell wall biosynthesis